jgi:hypothetical protein
MTMPGSNAGTGHRLNPRCYHCAKYRQFLNYGYVLHPTGKRRYRPTNYNGASGRTDVFWQYEVHCEDCKRVGWSRHIDLARWWKEEFE